MTDDKTYSAKSAAVRAARKQLGAAARPGEDFTVAEGPDGWMWAPVEKAPAPGAPPTEEATRSPGNAAEPQPAPPPPTGKLKASERALAGAPPRPMPRENKKTREAREAAERGVLPEPPDFSADTHKRFRPKLEELKALVAAKDVAGLRAYPIKPVSTSPKALDRYRNFAVIALEAKAR